MKDETAILRSTQGETMSLLGVTARGKAVGLHFELAVEQRYRNATATNLEVVYTFPLPLNAVLLDLEVRLGGKTLKGVVVEKSAGEAKYEEAIDKGDTAILLERAGDGLCTVNFGNLLAGEEATITYRYGERLRFEHGSVRLTIPTVIAPRYGDPKAAGLLPHQAPTHSLAQDYPFALTLELLGPVALGTLESPTHPIAVSPTDGGAVVTLARHAHLDRDFVLVASALAARSLAVVAKDGDEYVAMASFCARVPARQAEAPLRLKLLLDCSGSMGGDSIAAAKRALHEILARLEPKDRFSLSRFGSKVVHVTPSFTAAEEGTVSRAAKALQSIDADLGGTEMENALAAVFALDDRLGGADVLVITDGEVWGADSLVARARAAQQRVFVVGIGSAPAEGVLRKLAVATGGACEFVAPNEGVQQAILRTFLRLRAPRVERAEIAWPGTPTWVTPLPQGLFGGETLHAYAGYAAAPRGTATLKLLPTGDAEPLCDTVALPDSVVAEATMPRMAAALRIDRATPEEALALALRHQLLTAQTNCVIVHERAEDEKATGLPQLQKIAQMHAAGWGGLSTVHREEVLNWDICSRESRGRNIFSGVGGLDMVPEGVACVRSFDLERRMPEARTDREELEHFLARLEAATSDQAEGLTLPTSIDGLRRIGLDEALAADLQARVDAGNTEDRVVRAFLEALLPQAQALGLSRHLQRALRHQFATATEHEALRHEIAAWVAKASVPMIWL
ncbi:MAG: VWA domain-containing protein [Betaproteobacteria bacterium]|nr:VWA domain-containing protein [Betaproteobacteria bacterium]